MISTKNDRENKRSDNTKCNKALLLPYAAPYFVYVGIGSLLAGFLSVETVYILRIAVVSALLAWAWRQYDALTGPKNPFVSVLIGIPAGILGTFLWVLLLEPFVGAEAAQPWSEAGFYLRLASAGLVVPVFEELFMRGYILRFTLQWELARKSGGKSPFDETLYQKSIHEIPPGSWSWAAVMGSSVIFMLGHGTVEWLAAFVYGLLMASLWIVRKDLLACVTAHAVTNISLAIFVKTYGKWQLW